MKKLFVLLSLIVFLTSCEFFEPAPINEPTPQKIYLKVHIKGIVLEQLTYNKDWKPNYNILNDGFFTLLADNLDVLYTGNTISQFDFLKLPITFSFNHTLYIYNKRYALLLSTKQYPWTGDWDVNFSDYDDYPSSITLYNPDAKSQIRLLVEWEE